MRTKRIFLCVFLGLLVKLCFSQNVRDLISSFDGYVATHPVEKIYLHLDKPYYASGEYMSFRAYLTDMHLDQESVASHIIYVELSDERKEIVRRTLLYSEGREYAGQFLLPDSLPSANYHLRAYTTWMRNAGEDYFYHRDIHIGHPTEKKEIPVRPFDYELSFFPEGGRLLSGMTNRVAFKALANDGFGTNVSGTLRDETGREVLHFRSTHLGMGSFVFTPESGKTYTATVESAGRMKDYPLPLAVNGLGLSVRQTPDSIFLTVRSTHPFSDPVRVIAQSRHTVCYALTGLCRDREETVAIPVDKFPTGIAQFTLFKDNQPLSERLAFIDRHDDLRITVYWNPVLRTDKAGEAEVGFYTADNTGTYSYVLEGIGDRMMTNIR